jgi:hypothetical protein
MWGWMFGKQVENVKGWIINTVLKKQIYDWKSEIYKTFKEEKTPTPKLFQKLKTKETANSLDKAILSWQENQERTQMTTTGQ